MAVLRTDACEASVQLLPRGLLPLAPGSRRGRGGGASQAYGPPGSGLPACGLPRRRPLLTDKSCPCGDESEPGRQLYSLFYNWIFLATLTVLAVRTWTGACSWPLRVGPELRLGIRTKPAQQSERRPAPAPRAAVPGPGPVDTVWWFHQHPALGDGPVDSEGI